MIEKVIYVFAIQRGKEENYFSLNKTKKLNWAEDFFWIKGKGK